MLQKALKFKITFYFLIKAKKVEVETKHEDLSAKSLLSTLASSKHENVSPPASQSEEAESPNKSPMTTPHVQNG